jgi:hypothetical protein
MDQMRDHRYTFRLSKLEIQVQSILDQPFREFHSKGSEAIVLANSKEPPQNMIEEWPKKPKTHLLTIQQTLADTISEQVDSQRDSQVGSQAVPKRTLSWAQKTSSDQIHLIVFVHGYLGNTYDLRRYRNQLLHHISDLGLDETHHSYLNSAFNEQDTMSHLSTLGNNLAQEIWEHIFEYNLDDKLEKVSFVCHSMGALISRMAIRNDLLNPYKSKFYSFTSFASPHCSLLIHSHSILDPGTIV